MLDIGLTTIRQERVQSGGKERYCCTMSVNGMGFVETVLGLEERGQIFYMGHLQIAEWSWTEGMRKERPHS